MTLPSLFSYNIGGNLRITNVVFPEASQTDFRISQRHFLSSVSPGG